MVRKAFVRDVDAIYGIIDSFARAGVMLYRSNAEIYAAIRDFFVYEEDGAVAGVCSLHVWGPDIAEIRSLAVGSASSGRGIGRALVQACLDEARGLGVKKVFALTYKTGFFERLGFSPADKVKLPQKIWGDCVKCSKFPSCDESAVIIEIEGGERAK